MYVHTVQWASWLRQFRLRQLRPTPHVNSQHTKLTICIHISVKIQLLTESQSDKLLVKGKY